MSQCVVFSFGEGFGRPGAVAAASAAGHLPAGADVIVASTGLGDDSLELLTAGVEARDRAVTVIDSRPWVGDLPEVSRYVVDTWTRVFTAEWLPERYERVVYLDADTLTVAPLDPLFSMRLDADLAAMQDPVFPTFSARGSDYAAVAGDPDSPYFNTGVLVMDRSRWSGVADRALDLIRAGRLPLDYVDQDVLNVVMQGRWQHLDPRWHRLVRATDEIPDGSVLHFTGPTKPWAVTDVVGPAVEAYRDFAAGLGWTW